MISKSSAAYLRNIHLCISAELSELVANNKTMKILKKLNLFNEEKLIIFEKFLKYLYIGSIFDKNK